MRPRETVQTNQTQPPVLDGLNPYMSAGQPADELGNHPVRRAASVGLMRSAIHWSTSLARQPTACGPKGNARGNVPRAINRYRVGRESPTRARTSGKRRIESPRTATAGRRLMASR